jgi:hypothetical protein
MFDINTAINTAIAAAVEQAVKPLVERISTLETRLAEAALFTQTTNVTGPVDEAKMVEALNSQEWFWEKVGRFVTDNSRITVEDLHMVQRLVTTLEGARYEGVLSRSDVEALIEAAIGNHCETYDHDQYDDVVNEWGGECVSDFVKNSDGDIEEKINDALRNASFEVSVSL